MTIFLKGKTSIHYIKAIFPKIEVGEEVRVKFYVSPSIDEQCKRRSEAAKRGWKTRRSKKVPDENEWLKPDNKDNF
jgi:hypothetical protein